MDSPALVKDEAIRAVVDRLRTALGPSSFDIVDHWDADLCAVGIAKPQDHATLAYISTWRMAPGEYYLELEGLPASGDDMPTAVGRFESVKFDELLQILSSHIGVAV